MTEDVKYDIYTTIEAALEEIAELKHVLKYNSQDIDVTQEQQLNYPQAWLYFSSIEWKDNMQVGHQQNTTREQKGDFEITVRIAQHSFENDNVSWKTDLSIFNTVYRKLANLRGDNFTPLQRKSENDDTTNDNVRIWNIVFTTMGTECGVSNNKTDAAPVKLTIN